LPKTLNPEDIVAFRERLCDVAEGLFAERGPDAVTVRELAAELGVSPMTPYRYFADKDAMLAAVRARAFDRFAEAMEATHDQFPLGAEPSAEAANPYLDYAIGHPAAYRIMFDINQPTATRHPDLVRAMGRARATMSYGVRYMASQGLLKTDDIDLVSHAFWSAMHGPIMLELAGLLGDGVTARRLIQIALPVLRHGLIGRPKT
jgi:AcrR family transcriptional regulator